MTQPEAHQQSIKELLEEIEFLRKYIHRYKEFTRGVLLSCERENETGNVSGLITAKKIITFAEAWGVDNECIGPGEVIDDDGGEGAPSVGNEGQ